jgi:uncharacterized peroxidase-related enzyme
MTKSRGRIPNVQAVSSLKPVIMKTLMAHVSSVIFGESSVSRAEREMVAAEVSATIKCQYLTLAHAQALRGEDPESQLAEQLGENYHDAGLPPKQVTMLEFAEFLTTISSAVTEDWVEELRSVGWDDADVVALFNYMCCVADGLGVDPDTERRWQEQSQRLSFKDETAPKVFGKIAPMPESPVT